MPKDSPLVRKIYVNFKKTEKFYFTKAVRLLKQGNLLQDTGALRSQGERAALHDKKNSHMECNENNKVHWKQKSLLKELEYKMKYKKMK